MNRARCFDLLLLVPSLPLFLPLIAGLGVVTRIRQGPGIWFLQERIGLDGEPFEVYKIRTMSQEADPRQRRPTPFGHWLRRRGLDELPQLLNVLVGDMRLVGPRPLTPDDLSRLSKQCPDFGTRHQVPPGITGLAQVCQTRSLSETVRMEGLYVQHRSEGLDLRILLRTLWMNMVGKARGCWSPMSVERRLVGG